jgi:hypothetical protein
VGEKRRRQAIIKVLLPTDAQLNCPKNNFKIYIKTDIKTAPLVTYNLELNTG